MEQKKKKKMDVFQPQINYFETVPIEIMSMIFNHLNPADVIKCETMSQQAQVAAAYYYRGRFAECLFSLPNLLFWAECSAQDIELSFAETLCRVVGPYVKRLDIFYDTFAIDWAGPLSNYIRKYCVNLEHVHITGQPDQQIAMVKTENVKELSIKECLFDNLADLETSQELTNLTYQSKNNSSITDLVKLLLRYPRISFLSADISGISMEALRIIGSLPSLAHLILKIIPNDTENDRNALSSIDFTMCFKDLEMNLNLETIFLLLPFTMRLSREIVDTSIKSLRTRCNVNLTAVTFSSSTLQNVFLAAGENSYVRPDFDGLTGLAIAIPTFRIEAWHSVHLYVRLRVLEVILSVEQGPHENHPIITMLGILVEAGRREYCWLNRVRLCSFTTARVGVEHLPLIIEFLEVANELKTLYISNCTNELNSRESLMQTENTKIVFNAENN